MIDMEFLKGPFNTQAVRTASPFEVVGYFLTTEATRSGSWPFKILLPVLEAANRGEATEYATAGNAHMVRINNRTVRLEEDEDVVGRPPLSCEVPLQEFFSALKRWRDHLLEVEDAA